MICDQSDVLKHVDKIDQIISAIIKATWRLRPISDKIEVTWLELGHSSIYYYESHKLSRGQRVQAQIHCFELDCSEWEGKVQSQALYCSNAARGPVNPFRLLRVGLPIEHLRYYWGYLARALKPVKSFSPKTRGTKLTTHNWSSDQLPPNLINVIVMKH